MFFLGMAAMIVVGACLLATVSARAADDDEALRRRALALNDITGDNPIEGEIKVLVEDAKGTKKLLAVALKMAKEKEQPFNYNGALILAMAGLQIKELEASKAFFIICAEQAARLGSGQKLLTAYIGTMDVIQGLYQQKKYDESVQSGKEFLERVDRELEKFDRDEKIDRVKVANNFKADVMRRMIRALTKQNKTADAKKLIETLVKIGAANWQNHELKAWFERETGHEAEAAKLYEDLLSRIAKDEFKLKDEEKVELQADIRYVLSGLYVDINQVDKAVEQLRTLLAKEPNNPTYNNDLGYVLADHDKSLDEAEKMIQKAIDEERKERKKLSDLPPEEDKDNPAYLDSLGWVLYKKKKFKEAKKYLLEAIQDKGGQHIEIMDHVADVHMALGEKPEAIAIWNKALKLDTPSKREKQKKIEVEKKLKATQ
jgi:tetratricopeptide (TPR) repeat protein